MNEHIAKLPRSRQRGLRHPHAAAQRRRAGDRAPLRGFLHRRRRLAPLRDRSVQGDRRVHRRSGAARRSQVPGHVARRHLLGERLLPGDRRPHHALSRSARTRRCRPTPHRDIMLMERWMDQLGVDMAVMFPTPMLNLANCPRHEVEVGLALRLQPLALRQHPRQGAAHQVDALSAVPRSRGLLRDDRGVRRPQRRRRLHGDGDALHPQLREPLHEDLLRAAGARAAARLPRRRSPGPTRACRSPTASSRCTGSASPGATCCTWRTGW